jgi:hypothetical protein
VDALPGIGNFGCQNIGRYPVGPGFHSVHGFSNTWAPTWFPDVVRNRVSQFLYQWGCGAKPLLCSSASSARDGLSFRCCAHLRSVPVKLGSVCSGAFEAAGDSPRRISEVEPGANPCSN